MTDQSIHQDEEIWKPVVGYEGYYEVSSHGNVRSIDRMRYSRGRKSKNLIKGAPRKKWTSYKGYELVTLHKDRRSKGELVHRLVAIAFLEGNDESMDVNHIDGNRINNNINNLEFVTRRENICHGSQTKNKFKGSCFNKSKGAWESSISVNSKQIYLGMFSTEEQASAAYKKYMDDNGIINKYYK